MRSTILAFLLTATASYGADAPNVRIRAPLEAEPANTATAENACPQKLLRATSQPVTAAPKRHRAILKEVLTPAVAAQWPSLPAGVAFRLPSGIFTKSPTVEGKTMVVIEGAVYVLPETFTAGGGPYREAAENDAGVYALETISPHGPTLWQRLKASTVGAWSKTKGVATRGRQHLRENKRSRTLASFGLVAALGAGGYNAYYLANPPPPPPHPSAAVEQIIEMADEASDGARFDIAQTYFNARISELTVDDALALSMIAENAWDGDEFLQRYAAAHATTLTATEVVRLAEGCRTPGSDRRNVILTHAATAERPTPYSVSDLRTLAAATTDDSHEGEILSRATLRLIDHPEEAPVRSAP